MGGSMDIKQALCNEGITKGFAECRRLIFQDKEVSLMVCPKCGTIQAVK